MNQYKDMVYKYVVTSQLLKLHGHHKCHQLTPGSYPITTTHIESPPHIWDDFVGAYTPNLLALMGVLLQHPLKITTNSIIIEKRKFQFH
jgi:hypothetical protein